MTLARISEVDDPHCLRFHVDVEDKTALARAIALVLIQEYTLACATIAGEETTPDPRPSDEDVKNIVERRLGAYTFHRDGFLFQLMMWVLSHMDLTGGDIVSAPQTQAADKGQDSIILHFGAAKEPESISICEDKATGEPRELIRKLVWPELKEYETGARNDELRAMVITLLGATGVKRDDAVTAAKRIHWENAKRYRVRVTVGDSQPRDLYLGFAEAAPGDKRKRRGDAVFISPLRQWMDDLAVKVKIALQELAGPNIDQAQEGEHDV